MLVLLIIAVSVALVGPTISNRFTAADPRQTAVQLRAAMEMMRVRALEDGRREVLVVAPETNSYWHEGGSARVEVPPESGALSARGRYVRDEGEVEFHFYPDGTNSGGDVRVEQRRGSAVTAYMVSLNPLLGTAIVWREE